MGSPSPDEGFTSSPSGKLAKSTPNEIGTNNNGSFFLAKMNIDENQQIAAQLKIQSIPTIVAFYNKKIADGFQGALPKEKIKQFIEKILGKPLEGSNKEAFKIINELIEKNEFEESLKKIEEILSENSNDPVALSLYIHTLSNLNKFKDVKNLIESLSEELSKDANIKKSINEYKMLEKASKDPSLDILLEEFNSNPENVENLLKLSDKYFFEKKYEEAFDLLVNNYFKVKNINREKVKKNLIKFFDALGNTHEQTKIYRRKLSSLLFS